MRKLGPAITPGFFFGRDVLELAAKAVSEANLADP